MTEHLKVFDNWSWKFETEIPKKFIHLCSTFFFGISWLIFLSNSSTIQWTDTKLSFIPFKISISFLISSFSDSSSSLSNCSSKLLIKWSLLELTFWSSDILKLVLFKRLRRSWTWTCLFCKAPWTAVSVDSAIAGEAERVRLLSPKLPWRLSSGVLKTRGKI